MYTESQVYVQDGLKCVFLWVKLISYYCSDEIPIHFDNFDINFFWAAAATYNSCCNLGHDLMAPADL